MNSSVVQTRSKVARILAAALAVALFAVVFVLLVRSGPADAARHATATQETILTVRQGDDNDTLWLVSNEGTATAAGDLPGVAETVAVSPDGSSVAYLPFAGKPFVWIGHGPTGPKTISLAPGGVKTVTGLTWTSETQLVISGSKKANDASGRNDRLYTVDVATGTVAPLRNLAGTEPDASPDTGKIVYVKYRKLDNGIKNNGNAPKYRESLMLATMTGSGTGRVLAAEEYRVTEDYHAYAAPQIAPGGDWIAFGTTGSDVSVTYHVYWVGDDHWMPWFEMWMATPVAMAWAPDSPLVALGGAAVGALEEDAGLYVADAPGGAMARTSRDLLTKASIRWIMYLDWSDGGKIVADGLVAVDESSPEAQDRILLFDSADLSTVKDLGEGRLSVWVR